MYRCQICNTVSNPGDRAHPVTLRERERTYPHRTQSQATGRRKDRGKRGRWRADKGGRGREIAVEVVACKSCADAHGAPLLDEAPQRFDEMQASDDFDHAA